MNELTSVFALYTRLLEITAVYRDFSKLPIALLDGHCEIIYIIVTSDTKCIGCVYKRHEIKCTAFSSYVALTQQQCMQASRRKNIAVNLFFVSSFLCEMKTLVRRLQYFVSSSAVLPNAWTEKSHFLNLATATLCSSTQYLRFSLIDSP